MGTGKTGIESLERLLPLFHWRQQLSFYYLKIKTAFKKC
jgi:hypothetical protein